MTVETEVTVSMLHYMMQAFFSAQSTLNFSFHVPLKEPDWHVYSLLRKKKKKNLHLFLESS